MKIHNQKLADLPPDVRSDIETATYFVLEGCADWGDHVLLMSIEDAERGGYYAIHAGMADQPDHRRMLLAATLAEAIDKLALIHAARPDAGLWLSVMEVQAKIEHDNIARGVILARGSACPDDDEDEWWVMADHIAKCEAAGRPLDMAVNTSTVINTIVDRLR